MSNVEGRNVWKQGELYGSKTTVRPGLSRPSTGDVYTAGRSTGFGAYRQERLADPMHPQMPKQSDSDWRSFEPILDSVPTEWRADRYGGSTTTEYRKFGKLN